MSEIEIYELPCRQWAHPFDHKVQYDGETRGHDPSQDAIDGYYGCAWDEVFRDRNTDKLYRVSCWDGTNHSKSSHSPEDEEWMIRIQKTIVEQTMFMASQGWTQILLSSEEWAVMSGRTFSDWLDKLPDERYKTVGDANRYKLRGQVGTILGVPVVVDSTSGCPLEDPPSDRKVELKDELARIDKEMTPWEDFDTPHPRRGMRSRTGTRVRGPQWGKRLPNRRELTRLWRRRAA